MKKRVVKSQGFRSADGAISSIAGYEAMNIIRKGQIPGVPKLRGRPGASYGDRTLEAAAT